MNSRDAIAYCSSNNSTTCAVESISVPVMIAAMGAYEFIRDDEIIFEKSASKDKDYVVIEGRCMALARAPRARKPKDSIRIRSGISSITSAIAPTSGSSVVRQTE
jgi:hypothetical protein